MTIRDDILEQIGIRLGLQACTCACCRDNGLLGDDVWIQRCECEAEPDVNSWSCSACHTPYRRMK